MKESVIKSNSYLSFRLGNEEFASHVNKVLNILEMTKITEVPKVPFYMKGIINLRGMVLPVIDTRLKFGMSETEYTDKTCIIVMELMFEGETVFIGALVDEVKAVLEIEESEIQPPPNIGNQYRSEFITGIVNVNNDFVMILDMDQLFSSEELIDLKDQVSETPAI